MSAAEKAFGVIKMAMLMQERFEALDRKINRVADDLVDVGKEQAKLAERVAVMEGYLRGRADQAATQAQLAGPGQKEG
jgi:hypothetical protein